MSVFREAIYGVRFDDEHKEGVIERREEIVRCRDCVYRGWSEAGGHFCARGIGLTVDPDGFCAWGKKKR